MPNCDKCGARLEEDDEFCEACGASVFRKAEKVRVGRKDSSLLRGVAGIAIFLLVGAAVGYFGGHIVWIIFGQIQIAIGIAFPYAALYPPPQIYLIGWTIIGALSFPFKVLPALLD